MENKTQINLIQGDEFGIFDYTDLDETEREQKWMVLSYMIEQGKVRSEDVGTLFQNNPFFFDWYKRNVISDIPISETCH
tara:strand:+ start:1117 stop:1353 length:237 start_codon:yes stop_codon:yes gene_type:complete